MCMCMSVCVCVSVTVSHLCVQGSLVVLSIVVFLQDLLGLLQCNPDTHTPPHSYDHSIQAGCLFVRVCVYVFVCMYVCVCVSMCVCVCVWTHSWAS